jgi:hypothetical protein
VPGKAKIPRPNLSLPASFQEMARAVIPLPSPWRGLATPTLRTGAVAPLATGEFNRFNC